MQKQTRCYAQLSMRESRISPMTAEDVCPCSSGQAVSKSDRRQEGIILNAASITLISVAVVSSPVNAHQSLTTRPAPMTSEPRLTVPAFMFVRNGREWETIAPTYHQGYLEQAAQLVLVLYARFWMYETALVCDGTVASDEDVVGDGLAEYFDLEDVCDDFLGLAIDVGVDECDIVIAGDDVAESGETLLDALDADRVWEGIPEVLEFLICGRRGDEQTVSVAYARRDWMGVISNQTWLTCGQTADDASARDGCVHDGDDICEFCLERRIKVGRGVHGDEAVTVCEFGEHADIATVFELDAWGNSQMCRASMRGVRTGGHGGQGGR